MAKIGKKRGQNTTTVRLGRRLRTTTDLLNSAEFGCSEENESCSGGFPELIYSVRGRWIWPEAHKAHIGGPSDNHWSFKQWRILVLQRKLKLHVPTVTLCSRAVMGWRPTTDLLHVLASLHGRPVTLSHWPKAHSSAPRWGQNNLGEKQPKFCLCLSVRTTVILWRPVLGRRPTTYLSTCSHARKVAHSHRVVGGRPTPVPPARARKVFVFYYFVTVSHIFRFIWNLKSHLQKLRKKPVLYDIQC